MVLTFYYGYESPGLEWEERRSVKILDSQILPQMFGFRGSRAVKEYTFKECSAVSNAVGLW